MEIKPEGISFSLALDKRLRLPYARLHSYANSSTRMYTHTHIQTHARESYMNYSEVYYITKNSSDVS